MLQLLLNAMAATWKTALAQAVSQIVSAVASSERRIMAQIDDLKAAEDRIGTDIATAVATNAANLKEIADLIAKQSDPAPDLQALIDEAKAHADALEAAFPAKAADPAPAPATPVAEQPAETGAAAT